VDRVKGYQFGIDQGAFKKSMPSLYVLKQKDLKMFPPLTDFGAEVPVGNDMCRIGL
jgi:hypothetical protein